MKKTSALLFVCALAFALCGNAAPMKGKIDPMQCAPVNFTLNALARLGLVEDFGHIHDKYLSVQLLNDEIIGKTTGEGTEKGYPKGFLVHQFTHLMTYPQKNGGKPVKVLMVSECAEGMGSIDTIPLVYVISPVYLSIDMTGDNPPSILNGWNVLTKEVKAKQKKEKALD